MCRKGLCKLLMFPRFLALFNPLGSDLAGDLRDTNQLHGDLVSSHLVPSYFAHHSGKQIKVLLATLGRLSLTYMFKNIPDRSSRRVFTDEIISE